MLRLSEENAKQNAKGMLRMFRKTQSKIQSERSGISAMCQAKYKGNAAGVKGNSTQNIKGMLWGFREMPSRTQRKY